MFFKQQHLHFVGLGGIGMSGIAEVLLTLGYQISGSDLKRSAVTERLEKLGAKLYEGHAASNVGNAQAVVVSSAVRADNPEVQEARRRQIPVIPRGELLAELMRLKYGVAVAGSHGKTTTTSLIGAMLSHAGLDPTVVVGGRVGVFTSNARIGQSDFLVVESDESDGSFLKLAPIIAIVTNIDREHLDHYPTIEAIREAFADFVNKVPFYGVAIVCLDDENVQQILPVIRRRTVTYGWSAQADLVIREVQPDGMASRFRLERRGEDLGWFRVPSPGAHNVLNATAAVAVGLELDLTPEKINAGLASFTGVDRRFQIKGQAAGATVVDDYGHHPTEIRATLGAARQAGFRRVLVLFQPHRYSRTFHLMDDFARSFHQADAVFVTDIYAASEAPIEGVSGQALTDQLRAFGHKDAEFVGSVDQGARAISGRAREGDLLITLGAGTVSQAGDLILNQLRGGEQ